MQLPELINKHYQLIQRLTASKAFVKHIDKNELQSLVNINLCKFNGNTEDHFLKFVTIIIKNCVADYRKSNFGLYEFRTSQLEDYLIKPLQQDEIDLKPFIKKVCVTVNDLCKESYKMVFEEYFLNGLHSNEIAMKLNMPENTVKTTILKIRSLVNKKHGLTYKELITA